MTTNTNTFHTPYSEEKVAQAKNDYKKCWEVENQDERFIFHKPDGEQFKKIARYSKPNSDPVFLSYLVCKDLYVCGDPLPINDGERIVGIAGELIPLITEAGEVTIKEI